MGKDNSVFDIPVKPKKIVKKDPEEKESDITSTVDINDEKDISLPDSIPHEEKLKDEVPTINLKEEDDNNDLPVIDDFSVEETEDDVVASNEEEQDNSVEDNTEEDTIPEDLPVIGDVVPIADEETNPEEDVPTEDEVVQETPTESFEEENEIESNTEENVDEHPDAPVIDIPSEEIEQQVEEPTPEETTNEENIQEDLPVVGDVVPVTEEESNTEEVEEQQVIDDAVQEVPGEESLTDEAVEEASNSEDEQMIAEPVVVDVTPLPDNSEEVSQVVDPIPNDTLPVEDTANMVQEPLITEDAAPVTELEVVEPVVEASPSDQQETIVESEVPTKDAQPAITQEAAIPLDQSNPTVEEAPITPEVNNETVVQQQDVAQEQVIESVPSVSNETTVLPDTQMAEPNNQDPAVEATEQNTNQVEMQPETSQLEAPYVPQETNGDEISPFVADGANEVQNSVDESNPSIDLNNSNPDSELQAVSLSADNNLQSTSLNTGNVIIPESLDQNYGVIGEDTTIIPTPPTTDQPNKKEEKPKKEKKPKEKKIKEKKPKEPSEKKIPWKVIIIALVGLFLAGCIVVGFLIYKLFSVDVVNSTTLKIKEVANDLNSTINGIDAIKLIQDKDEWQLQAKLTTNDNYVADLTGGLSKESNKFNIKGTIKKDDEIIANISRIDINSSSFIRYIEDSYYYRFVDEDRLELKDYISSLNIKTILDNFADIISKNISSNKFSGNIMRVTINGKTKLVNNYSYTLPKDKALEILNRFTNSIENPSVKQYLKDIGLDHVYGDVEINAYVSLSGLEQIVISNNGHQIKISNPKKNSFVIIYDTYKFSIDKQINKIDISIEDTKSNKKDNLNLNWNSKTDENSGILDAKLIYGQKTLDLNLEIKSVDKAILETPSNFIMHDSIEAQETYEYEYNLVHPNIEQFNVLKK